MSAVQPVFGPGPSNRVIPYDYQFRIELDGERTVRKQTIEVSTEGPFSAVSIGYAVVPALVNFTFGPVFPGGVIFLSSGGFDNITLGDIRRGAEEAARDVPALRSRGEAGDFVLKAGIQLNPA